MEYEFFLINPYISENTKEKLNNLTVGWDYIPPCPIFDLGFIPRSLIDNPPTEDLLDLCKFIKYEFLMNDSYDSFRNKINTFYKIKIYYDNSNKFINIDVILCELKGFNDDVIFELWYVDTQNGYLEYREQ